MTASVRISLPEDQNIIPPSLPPSPPVLPLLTVLVEISWPATETEPRLRVSVRDRLSPSLWTVQGSVSVSVLVTGQGGKAAFHLPRLKWWTYHRPFSTQVRFKRVVKSPKKDKKWISGQVNPLAFYGRTPDFCRGEYNEPFPYSPIRNHHNSRNHQQLLYWLEVFMGLLMVYWPISTEVRSVIFVDVPIHW